MLSDSSRYQIVEGDALTVLSGIADQTYHAVITSPPYWGLRDYRGGREEIGQEECPDCLGWARDESCDECYVCRLLAVFAEVHRVLRDDGTLCGQAAAVAHA